MAQRLTDVELLGPALVQLSTLPRSTWKGRAVFHPLLQQGEMPWWTDEAIRAEEGEEAEPGDPCGPAYDVGVVVDWWIEDGDEEFPRVHAAVWGV